MNLMTSNNQTIPLATALTDAEIARNIKREKKRKAKAIYVTSRICVRLFYCQALSKGKQKIAKTF